MDIPGLNDFGLAVPTLPHGVVECEGLRRATWITKAITLTNEEGDNVAKGICHSVDATLVIDIDGKPLGDDHVAIQIAESLGEVEVPSLWMWAMRSWHISRVYLNSASLYDHEQTNIYNSAVNASTRRIRNGVRTYNSTRERRELNVPPKREYMIST